MERLSTRRFAIGAFVAVGSFAILGTIAALWDNPLFIRMTPVGGFEISLLALQSGLLGIFFAIRRPTCSARLAGAGGVLNFLGVACPVCNKLLVLLFGGELLLTYLEPVRVYVAAGGALITTAVVVREWRRRSRGSRTPTLADPA